MVAPCALCKGKNPPRTHVFPQNSRAEVQVKWVKAMGLPQAQEDEVLEEMRQLEQKGNRPRWCTFHFEYDKAGIHFPKYFDPEEGKAAQGWKDEEEEQGPSTNHSHYSEDGSPSPAEKRRSSRKRSAPTPAPSTSSITPGEELSLKKILAEVGISLPGMEDDEDEKEKESQKPSSSRKKVEVATSVEKTLQSILMDAGLPVPETLQAKTGVLVDEDEDEEVPSQSLRFRQPPSRSAVATMTKATTTVSEARRQGALVPTRGGATLSKPKMLMNPMSNKYSGGEWPKVLIPKPTTPKLPVYCYNHNTMEKYDDSDSLRHFTMPCSSLAKNCQSELTVIMSRARALEDQFDEMSNCVLRLVQLYKTKTPLAYRPPQSLATISGRAASVAGPVIGRPIYNTREGVVPIDSLAVQERRERRMESRKKEPERLLTDDDLASTVRRRLIKEEQSSADDEEEEEEMDEEESEDDDKEYRPSISKRRRVSSAREADASASEASPPMLEMIE